MFYNHNLKWTIHRINQFQFDIFFVEGFRIICNFFVLIKNNISWPPDSNAKRYDQKIQFTFGWLLLRRRLLLLNCVKAAFWSSLSLMEKNFKTVDLIIYLKKFYC